MIFGYILLLMLCVSRMTYRHSGFNTEFMEKHQCNVVKGIGIFLVFWGHMQGYLVAAGYYNVPHFGDSIFRFVDKYFIDQLMVVMFLFYSGYGVMERVKVSGVEYVQSMPKRRILRTLVNFDIAVLAFAILGLFLGNEISVKRILPALTGWTSLGNSNWYVFVIILCYVIMYVSFHPKCFWSTNRFSFMMLFFLMSVTMLVLMFVKKDSPWWYNKLMVFPFGVLWSVSKEKLLPYIKKHYFQVVTCTIFAFALTYLIPWAEHQFYISDAFRYNVRSCLFAASVVLILMKVKMQNSVLEWLGRNLFPIYIYQRIPMMFISLKFGADFLCRYTWAYVGISITVTLLFAYLYRWIEIKNIGANKVIRA